MADIFAIISPFSVFAAPRLCAALAGVMCDKGKRVLLLELCPTVPALAETLGVADKVVYTLSDIGHVGAQDVLLPVTPTLKKSKKGQPTGEVLLLPLFAGEELPQDAASRLCAAFAATQADIVLICAELGQASLARAVADSVLLLTSKESLCLRTAAAHRATIAADGFVLTDFLPTDSTARGGVTVTDAADALGLPTVGILPAESYALGRPYDRAAENLALRLLGNSVPLLQGVHMEGLKRKAYLKGALR